MGDKTVEVLDALTHEYEESVRRVVELAGLATSEPGVVAALYEEIEHSRDLAQRHEQARLGIVVPVVLPDAAEFVPVQRTADH